jgi:glycosyltransferase involved in cell wall biosynthesis
MNRFNPFDDPLCLAFPHRLAPSEWLEHVPFGMFLIGALRPSVVVELGTHHGVSYCAFCQAVKELSLDARAYAVDTWQGDSQSGFYGSDVLTDLRRHHDPLYNGFSRLLQSTFDDACRHFSDQSIDLLHIDGFHTYEAVKHDFISWLPKVRSSGIVLFHDVNVREGDFGVWKLWEEIRQQYPSFAFVHQHGLGVLALGQSYPEALRPFLDHAEGAPELRNLFFQLGQRISSHWKKQQAVQELTVLVKNKEKEINDNWAIREQENQALVNQIRDRDRSMADLAAQLASKQEENKALASQLGERDQIINTLTSRVASKEQENRTYSLLLEQKNLALQRIASRSHIGSSRGESRAAGDSGNRVETSIKALARPYYVLRHLAGKGYRLGRRIVRVWREKGTWALVGKLAQRLPISLGSRPRVFGQDLRVVIDDLPTTWQVGKGNLLHLTGSCYHPESSVSKLELAINGASIPATVTMMRRPDVFQADYPEFDPRGHSLYSGFCALLPVPSADTAVLHLTVEARLRTGITVKKLVGEISVSSPKGCSPEINSVATRCSAPVIAICMTTYNPALELFTRQIRSIQAQTNSNWLCIITDDCSEPAVLEQIHQLVADDSRFVVVQNCERLGFYHNFEKCLSLVPAGVDFVALADHDDCWHPDKLATLVAAFDDQTTLVYSDMNIVSGDGRSLASTYWTNRHNNYRRLGSLFLANTITGAASMFRRSLLDYVLPFPDRIGSAFHDHWIGCAALSLGKIHYVDRPLYEYVQHQDNVIGHYTAPRALGLGTLLRLGKMLVPFRIKTRFQAYRAHIKAIYVNDVLRIQHLARVLLLRGGAVVPPDKQKTLHRLAHLDSLASAGWLLGRSLISFQRKTVTMGAENCLLRGIGWKRCMNVVSRWRARHVVGLLFLPGTSSDGRHAVLGRTTEHVTAALERVEFIEQKTAPLNTCVTPTAPRRVNLLIPTVDFQYVFGGYITKFHLARCLAEEGYRVRIILVDYCDYQPHRWKQRLRAYPGLERLLDQVEVTCAFDRSVPIAFHPRDAVIATTWWTAHIAHAATRMLHQSRFAYLIQEFEPFTFPMGTYAALADQSYAFPHHAVFSTEFLRDYFRQNNLGVFVQGREMGDRHSTAFANTITAVGHIGVRELAGRSPRKLLFYARPEPHAARNMFELGIAALIRAIRAGCFHDNWEFHGIGTVNRARQIRLAHGSAMRLLPRQSQDSYRELLREYDLGLSLMYTPHPSLVPIEMASAGMLTVTNTWKNKTEALMKAISSNLIAVAPTIEAVEHGLQYAADHIEDYEARVRGAEVNWPSHWDQAFNPTFMDKLKEFLECDDSLPVSMKAPQAA